jgi:hypothetical protein
MNFLAKTLLAATFAALAATAVAQSTERPRPPGTVPLQEPPPPPPGPENLPPDDPRLKPVISERDEGDKHIQEYRIGGKLYMQKVTPKHGRPYVLFDNPLGPGVRVPQWVILEF